jgi:hypothetical protein
MSNIKLRHKPPGKLMSRAFVKEDADQPAALPDRPISAHPNDVTPEGLRLIENMLEQARKDHAAALAAQDRSALSHASRDLRYWSARCANARVVPPPSDSTTVRFGSSVIIFVLLAKTKQTQGRVRFRMPHLWRRRSLENVSEMSSV